MSNYRLRNALLLAKAQTGAGVNANPTAAANAMLVQNVSINPIEAEEVERELVTGKAGNFQKLLTGVHASVSFDIELAGAGAAGTAAPYSAVLRGCALAEVLTASVDATYSLVDSGESYVTLAFHRDGIKHTLLDARGSVKYGFTIGGIPKATFTYKGLYVAPTSAAFPSGTFTAFQVPQDVSKLATALTIDGLSVSADSFELDQANELTYHELTNAQEILIVNRKPAGQFVIEVPALGTKDFFAKVLSEAPVAWSLVHGVGAGNIIDLSSAQMQLGKPSYSDKNGQVMMTMPFTLLDNYVLKVR